MPVPLTSSSIQGFLDGLTRLAVALSAHVRREVEAVNLDDPERHKAIVKECDDYINQLGRALGRLHQRQADRALRRGQLDRLLRQMDATPDQRMDVRTGLQDLRTEAVAAETWEEWRSRRAEEPPPLIETALDLRPAVQAVAPCFRPIA